ncbi:MAG TPA: hypothetical protein VGN71_03510 [Solirubrobacteraceae bacterium]|nr:hypothetical protein [Solirubrobacteraceae bacterium]
MTARRGTCACLAAVLLAAPALSACGGGARPGRGQRGEEAEREAAKAKLPAADRIAFYQLATATGLLRASASAAARGRAAGAPIGAQLTAAAARVATLRPRDRALAALRDRLTAALQLGPGRASLAATTALVAGLQRYARSRPEYQALVPD